MLQLIRSRKETLQQIRRKPGLQILKTTYDQQTKAVKRAITKEKEDRFNRDTSELDHRNSTIFWTVIKRLTTEKTATEKCPTMKNEDRTITNNEEEAAQNPHG